MMLLHVHDMLQKQLSLHVQNGRLGHDGHIPVRKARPVLITSLTHLYCQRSPTKWDQFRLVVLCL